MQDSVGSDPVEKIDSPRPAPRFLLQSELKKIASSHSKLLTY